MEKQRIVLSSGGTLAPMREILKASNPGYEPHYLNCILDNEIEDFFDGIRIYNKCKLSTRIWLAHLDTNLKIRPYPYHPLTVDSQGNVDASSHLHDKRDFEEIATLFTKTIHQQIEEFGLRDRHGFLLGSYVPMDDPNFNEIVISHWPGRTVQHE